MKKLLKGFYDHEKLYNFVGLGKEFLEEVVELANGDARKALNLLYMRGIEDKADKIRQQEIKKVEKYELDKKPQQRLIK
jgi:replication-associated recombination protein RarA